MMISVIICTYNRCKSLQNTVDSIFHQRNGEFNYELIIVDNNSNDLTKDLVESNKERFNGNLRYVQESIQGLAYARNSGIKNAGGELIVFTEDDVEVDENWLLNIFNSFKQYNWDAMVGRINLVFDGVKPSWISDRFMSAIAWFDAGNEPKILNSSMALVGANMAIKAEVFKKIGNFDIRFNSCAYDDTEMSQRLQKHGGLLYYCPNVIVHHHIPPGRMTKKAFRKNYFRQGNADSFVDDAQTSDFKLVLYYLKEILKDIAKACIYFTDEEKRTWHECQAAFRMGYLKGIVSRMKK